MTEKSSTIFCKSRSPAHAPLNDPDRDRASEEYCSEHGDHDEHRCCCGFTWTDDAVIPQEGPE